MRPTELLAAYFSGEQLADKDLELVQAYRQECIDRARSHTSGLMTSYYEDFELVVDKLCADLNLAEHFKGRPVIELGPGKHPLKQVLLEKYGVSDYTGVELSGTSQIEVVREDVLTYLSSVSDNSALVVSCGLMCPELILDLKGRNLDYFRFVGREIFRVTPRGSVSVHITNNLASHVVEGVRDMLFTDHGFQILHQDSRCPGEQSIHILGKS